MKQLLIWLLIQLAVLAISALRIPLWSRYPQCGETLALGTMFVAQILFASLLFPILFSDRGIGVMTVCIAVIFLHLAGYLAGRSLPEILFASAYLVAWLAGCASVARTIRDHRRALVGTTVIGLLLIGGFLWSYLAVEYGSASATCNFSPLCPTPNLDFPRSTGFFRWIAPFAMLAWGEVRLRSSKRQVIHQ